ncbi:MAG: hypothetical protein IJ794_04095 [Lachnospiraceae bacterium]|nr:hypothetical protein [Lachnospiraceae bacterium]
MNVLKSISLFFLLPLTMFVLGFVSGVKTEHYFYPGENWNMPESGIGTEYEAGSAGRDVKSVTESITVLEKRGAEVSDDKSAGAGYDADVVTDYDVVSGYMESGEYDDSAESTEFRQVSAQDETLSADTDYVLREADLLHGTEVETIWQLPGQYIGMNRERFQTSVQTYSDYPPLSELERGFVGAEVVSFSRERVIVRKSYQYVRPDEVFYLAVQDNEVVVFLEDKETVYMNTGILLDTLPEELQLQIMRTIRIESETELYGFLENYSS